MIPTTMEMQFRWMAPHDVPQVAAMIATEAPCHSIDEITDILTRTIRKRSVGALVAEAEPTASVCGFAAYRANRGFAELFSVCVDPRYRRTRVATRMILRICEILRFTDRKRLEAVVRERKLAAQLLLRSMSFRANEVLRGHFDDGEEDGYKFELFL